MGGGGQHIAYLGLGANLGDRVGTICHAIELIGELAGTVEARSALYYSAAWGFDSENTFVNVAVRIATPLAPLQLLDTTQAIERLLGKTERHATVRTAQPAVAEANGETDVCSPVYRDRPIDIDLLLYDDLTIDTPRLKIPHPLMHERPFVMEPLRQVLAGKEKT